MRAVIIEDEGLASRHLQKLLQETGPIQVMAVLESIVESVVWFQTHPLPEVVFMDIHLADGLSFEIFNQVQISCPVIFTTAYDEYALKAFKVNSIDYLMKPVEQADIRQALKKLDDLTKKEIWPLALEQLLQSYKPNSTYKTTILIPQKGDKLFPMSTSDIAYICIDQGSVRAVTFDQKSYRLEYHLDELATILHPEKFFRANRQYIIARKAIKDIDLWFNNRLSINLQTATPEKILISKARISEFKAWLGA